MLNFIPTMLFTESPDEKTKIIISIICALPLTIYTAYEIWQNVKKDKEIKLIHAEHQDSLNKIIELTKQRDLTESFNKSWESKWNRFIEKHGDELDGIDFPNYFGYINKEYTEEDIELLYKTNLLSKSKYESYKRISGLIL